MLITQLDIASQLGDNVWYKHSDDDNLGPFTADGWWHKNNVQHNSLQQTDMPHNVVNLERNGWIDHGLNWAGEQEDNGNVVVYANFPRHENK